MARTILAVGAAVWLLLGACGVALALAGRERLMALIPGLAIDADALGGALIAMSFGMFLVGAAHLVLVAGMRRRSRRVLSAGALLAAVMCALSVALGAAALASALREAAYALPLSGGALVATVGAVAYARVAVRLVREVGSGSAP